MEPKETDLAKKEKTGLQVAEQLSPNQMIQLAITSNADLDKVQKALGLLKEFEAHEAKKDFTADFAVAQSNISAVVKTKHNPQTNSKYAGLDSVLDMARPVYTAEGFSVVFHEGKAEKAEDIRVCADVLHKAGHKETYHYDVPLGGVGIKGTVNMTAIHAKATSVTYGQRYLLCMIWNIPTKDADGNPPEDPKDIPKPTDEEQKRLDAMCEAMTFFVPDGLTLDKERVRVVVWARAKQYPPENKTPDACAKWLVDILNKDDSWETVTKAS